MLSGLKGIDRMAALYPIEGFAGYGARIGAELSALKALGSAQDRRDRRAEMRKRARMAEQRSRATILLRRVRSTAPFRERLVQFWADHFTAAGKDGFMRFAQPTFAEDVVRPNLAGRFEDMLIAATLHPVMLDYLDQDSSSGPESAYAARTNKPAGLNENLAREVLELHTLGVGGAYGQGDVQQLAELFTGLTYNYEAGTVFRPNRAEPGSETVLGQTYGGASGRIDDVIAVLRDLAAHPDTALHLARKLAVHFVADTPDPDLVDWVADSFRASGGDLLAMYAALLDHPASWDRKARNVKQPLDFVGSAMRALDIPDAALTDAKPYQLQQALIAPMEVMGFRPGRPPGPDGLAEEDETWISPQSLAARLRWSMTVPITLRRNLPDPRAFAETALGSRLTGPVRFAAEAAETTWEGVGLVLASPAFQTM